MVKSEATFEACEKQLSSDFNQKLEFRDAKHVADRTQLKVDNAGTDVPASTTNVPYPVPPSEMITD